MVWVKTCRAGRAFEQERRAYVEVAPKLRALGIVTPELLDVDVPKLTLTLSVLSGEPATMQSPEWVFASAGRALSAMHGLACTDEDAVPLRDALLLRAEAWARRASQAGVVGMPDVVRAIERSPLGGARVWCHRDFQPQNWVVAERVGILDFEHCRPDHPLVDWVRLEAREWSPRARQAFVRGYGAEPNPEELRAMLCAYGVATVTWATEHGDAQLLLVGRRALGMV